MLKPEHVILTALVVGGGLGPATVLNSSILDSQCEEQLRAECQGLPPAQQHIDQEEPSQPLLGVQGVHAATTDAGPPPMIGAMAAVNSPDIMEAFGTTGTPI
jgi:hypothetical protein